MLARSIALLVAGLFATSAMAQDVGLPPFGSLEDGGFDTVNRENLNVHFSIPLVSVPGRGMDLGAALRYDSIVWQKVDSTWKPVDDEGIATFGWKTETPTGSTSFSDNELCCGIHCIPGHAFFGYVFTDPSGTKHSFPVSFVSSENCGGPTGPRTAEASDDSGYFLDATFPRSPVVFTPDGTKYAIDGTVTDRNGNFISKSVVSANETQWIDTANRTALKIVKSANYTDYLYQDTPGAYQTIRLNYASRTVRTNFGCSGVSEYYQSGVKLPSSLVFPNGQTYTFTYDRVE